MASRSRLFLFLDEFKGFAAQGVARILNVDPKDQVAIVTLADMARQIHKQDFWEEVILFVHGFAGGILVDGQGLDLDGEEIRQAFPKNRVGGKDASFPNDLITYIKNIRFEGCWIGEDPKRMATFGKLFDAQTVSAFNWTMNTDSVTVTIPRGSTAASLQGVLTKFERWIMPGSPTIPVLASMARTRDTTVKLPLMWYRYALEDDPDKAPFVKDNFERMGRHTYAIRSEATEREIAAERAVSNAGDPSPPFEHVTVRLRGGNLRDV
jgi:hypothetical protein